MSGGRPTTGLPEEHPAGLCGVCRHARVVENRRGSRFWLCRLSTEDPAFPRYPHLPVRRCRGFRDGRADGEDAPGGGGRGSL